MIDNEGKVRGPKAGTVCVEKNPARLIEQAQIITITTLKSFVNTIHQRWNSKNISAGLVETMIVDTLMHRTKCVDEELVRKLNTTIYNNLGPDPRNKLDATRKTGLFPKCASTGCFNNKFISKSTGNNYFLHDQMFRVNLVLQLADKIIESITDPEC